MDRYSRQCAFPRIGVEGQRKIGDSTAVLVGCGALGSVIANTLVRAGVGKIRIIDRDFVEMSNLQRQVIFDESDVRARTPKAVAAVGHLRRVNSEVELEPVVADVTPANIEKLCESADVILDGSDNFELRFLINDLSVKSGVPWVYGGCRGADGQTMTIIPRETACLTCLMLDGPPPPGATETCDVAGVLSPIINVIASIQSLEAIKILSGRREDVSRKLQVFSLWTNDIRQMDLSSLRDQVNCPTCQQRQFKWLDGKQGSQSSVLCGRNAVQLSFGETDVEIGLPQVAKRLKTLGDVQLNEYLLRFAVDGFELTLFADGRAIVSGTDDPSIARKLYAQYVGQ